MTKELKNRIHLIYGILLSVVAVGAGICFIVSAYNIYQAGLAAGTQPYTVDTIAAAFSKIAVPVYALIALVLGGIVLQAALPLERKKCVPEKNLPLILERLQAKTDLSACDERLQAAVAREEGTRRLHSAVCGGLLAAAGALFLSYACNGENWAPVDAASEINACMVRAVFAMAICLVIPFSYCVFTAFYCRRSYEKQIRLMKEAHTQAPVQASIQADSSLPIGIHERSVGMSIFLTIITLGIYGIYWQYLLVKNTRTISKNENSCVGEMLCLIFVPFYSLYWWFTRGQLVKNEFSKQGYGVFSNGTILLILSILGLDIVASAIMQKDFNSLPVATHLNQRITNETVLRYCVLVLAVALIVYGACTGGTADVLAKAAAICTECVGLG